MTLKRIAKKFAVGILTAVLMMGNTLSAFASEDTAWEMSGIAENKDLEWLKTYIAGKKTVWEAQQRAKMEAVGIASESIHFVDDESCEGMEKEMLCMMAVYRGYTFYNRVVCMWYIDNLFNEMHTYRIVGNRAQNNALITASPIFNFMKMLCVDSGPDFGSFGRGLAEKSYVSVILGRRSAEELYGTDKFTCRIPISWDGWSEEKMNECRELIAMDEETLAATLAQRQEESLAASPAPLYKQGAAEWCQESFGNGTMASDACCPTAIATVLSGLTGQRITPLEVAKRYDNDFYRDPDSGSYGGKMCDAAGDDYGIPHEAGTEPLTSREIRAALKSGAMIVMSMTPKGDGGYYATVFHYVALTGLTGGGQVIVNNPGINTDVTYDDIQTILDNQSGRGYGIFFPSEGTYRAYEAEMHPEPETESTESE